jgi:hypothetical protein
MPPSEAEPLAGLRRSLASSPPGVAVRTVLVLCHFHGIRHDVLEAHDAHEEDELKVSSCSSPFRQAQGDPEPCRGVVVFVIIVIVVGADLPK